jgi:hypothetical protein
MVKNIPMMGTYLFTVTILVIIFLIFLYRTHITNSNTNEIVKEEFKVNEFLQDQSYISTQKTCDPSKGSICYIDGIPKKIVDTVIANVQEDDYYRTVFKKIRSFTPENIYRCVDKIDPLMSATPLKTH